MLERFGIAHLAARTPERALRRRAPARRARPRARARPRRPAPRRAALGARRPHQGRQSALELHQLLRDALRCPTIARHARLRGRRGARRHGRRDRRRQHPPDRDGGRARRALRPTRSSRPSPAQPASRHRLGTRDGLTEVVLDSGGTAWSTDAVDGRVGRQLPPDRDLPRVDDQADLARARVGRVDACPLSSSISVSPPSPPGRRPGSRSPR